MSVPIGKSRLGIDARMLDAATGTGVSTYARALLAAATLLDRAPVLVRDTGRRFRDMARVMRALPPWPRLLSVESGTNGQVLVAPDIFRLAQVHFSTFGRVLPLRAPGPPGIMHWTYPVPLRLTGWKNVYTVHDAIPLDQPDLTPIRRERHARMLRAIFPHAAAITTVSQTARESIVAATGFPADRVVDCGQSAVVPRGPLPAPDHYPSRGYFLFCGAIEPRKNLIRLAEAHQASGTPLPLLIVGPDSWRTGEILTAMGDSGDVRRLPFQSREALLGLMAHARALLFPSLAEGFGLPVAEAMGLGTAVLTSHDGALAETAGDAALLVNPADTGSIADGIARLTRDEALVADLIARGRMRAMAFSRERFAQRLAAFYATL